MREETPGGIAGGDGERHPRAAEERGAGHQQDHVAQDHRQPLLAHGRAGVEVSVAVMDLVKPPQERYPMKRSMNPVLKEIDGQDENHEAPDECHRIEVDAEEIGETEPGAACRHEMVPERHDEIE